MNFSDYIINEKKKERKEFGCVMLGSTDIKKWKNDHISTINEDDLYISKIYINEGPTLKRFKPRARGRAARIRKRTSHVVVYVTDGKEEEVKEVGTKS